MLILSNNSNIQNNLKKTKKKYQKICKIYLFFLNNALFIYKHLENPNVFCKLEMETGL